MNRKTFFKRLAAGLVSIPVLPKIIEGVNPKDSSINNVVEKFNVPEQVIGSNITGYVITLYQNGKPIGWASNIALSVDNDDYCYSFHIPNLYLNGNIKPFDWVNGNPKDHKLFLIITDTIENKLLESDIIVTGVGCIGGIDNLFSYSMNATSVSAPTITSDL
jgi:hypothetical protein